MDVEKRIGKIESEIQAILRVLGYEVVFRKRETGLSDHPFEEEAVIVPKIYIQ